VSLVDPDTRWWRTNQTRILGTNLLMVLGLGTCFVGSWGMLGLGADGAVWVPEGVALACIIASLPVLIGGALLRAFLVDGDAGESRMVRWALPLYFIANGTGALLGEDQTQVQWNAGIMVSPLFIAGGIVAILVIELVRRHSRAAAQVRDRVERSGVTTSGTVTRAKSYSLNYHLVTRVTVRFTDRNGQERWAGQTVAGEATTGDVLKVRYSPADLGRKAAVVVSRR